MKKLVVFIVVLLVAMGTVYALFTWRELREESPQRSVVDLPVSALKDKGAEEKQKRKVTLFFPATDNKHLREEQRPLTPPERPQELVSLLIKQLVKGPADGGYNTIPAGTELRGAFFDGRGAVYLDFSPELKDGHIPSTGAEALTVYSIVNTVIANIDDVKIVYILVDGMEVETLGGHMALNRPFRARPEMVVNSAR
jgi:spore germination protein GerM